MQLLSALLSVTVLLAQAASGFTLTGAHPVLRLYFGLATVHEGIVGFHGNKGDLVDIDLEGNRITNGCILQFLEPDWYIFKSSKGITRSSLDLDAPFERDGGKFRFGGHEDAKWFLCPHANNSNGPRSDIYLSVDGRARDESCMEVRLYPS